MEVLCASHYMPRPLNIGISMKGAIMEINGSVKRQSVI